MKDNIQNDLNQKNKNKKKKKLGTKNFHKKKNTNITMKSQDTIDVIIIISNYRTEYLTNTTDFALFSFLIGLDRFHTHHWPQRKTTQQQCTHININ